MDKLVESIIKPLLKEIELPVKVGDTVLMGRFKNKKVVNHYLTASVHEEKLEDLSPIDVFNRCLEDNEVDSNDKDLLLVSYSEILKSIQEEDLKAE